MNTARIKDLFDVIRVGCVTKRLIAQEGDEGDSVKVVTNTFLNSDNKEMKTEHFDSYLYVKHHEKYELKVNDIVVSLVYPYGSLVVSENEAGAFCTHYSAILRRAEGSDKPEIDPYYIKAIFDSDEFGNKDNGRFASCLGGERKATSAISLDKLSEIEIPMLPIEEQKRIGVLIRSSNERIKMLQNLIDAEKNLVDAGLKKLAFGDGSKSEEAKNNLAKKYGEIDNMYIKLRNSFN